MNVLHIMKKQIRIINPYRGGLFLLFSYIGLRMSYNLYNRLMPIISMKLLTLIMSYSLLAKYNNNILL